MTVTVRFFAAAKAAAGTGTAQAALEDLPRPTIAGLCEHLAAQAPQPAPGERSLGEVLQRCSFLRNGTAAPVETALQADDAVDALPPFAGG